jgi:predicted ABC-type ATPase
MPEIIIVAGPNGAGKTSFARQYVNSGTQRFAFVNADEISRELSEAGTPDARRDLEAARIMLKRLDELTATNSDFIVETTLAALTYLNRIKDWRQRGYRVTLIYLRLASADQAVVRVRRRVAAGGHDIPEKTIRRRFTMGLEYLEKHYKTAVDEWYIWDSLEGEVALSEAWDD